MHLSERITKYLRGELDQEETEELFQKIKENPEIIDLMIVEVWLVIYLD